MDFSHEYLNMRSVVYVYIFIYKYISYFIKMRGEEYYPANCFIESSISLLLEQMQRICLYAGVLSFAINGVDHTVRGGTLRHSRGKK